MRFVRNRSWLWVGLGAAGWLVLSGCASVIDEEAQRQFKADLGDTTITVFPAFIRDGESGSYNGDAAQAIADFLADADLAEVTVSDAEVPITGAWGMDQSAMYRESVASLVSWVEQHPLETEYAMLPEYLIGGRGTVVGVHLYAINVEGAVVYGMGKNSHHDAFNEVDPQDADDCTTIVINVMRDELVEDGG